MAHCQEKGWFYLIRIRDGKSSMKQSLDLPHTETFDESFTLKLTRRQNKETRELLKDRNHYKFIPSNQTFDFLSKEWERGAEAEFYSLSFRMVRFEIAPDKYETLVTN
ncbi:TPA: IS4 family transposase, partial [Streptococcus suis]